jgi:hypothetical protein
VTSRGEVWPLDAACPGRPHRQAPGAIGNALTGHTEPTEYIGRVPAPPLNRFIDDIYCLTGVPRHRRMNVPPMPSAHLFVNPGEPVRRWDSVHSAPPGVCTEAWFMGVWTSRSGDGKIGANAPGDSRGTCAM